MPDQPDDGGPVILIPSVLTVELGLLMIHPGLAVIGIGVAACFIGVAVHKKWDKDPHAR